MTCSLATWKGAFTAVCVLTGSFFVIFFNQNITSGTIYEIFNDKNAVPGED